ncbi:MAG: dihydrofolate reductase family protein [Candidatus Nanopelagicaceae bacterium]|nr:dihydrofolate reductase family protein [Candidatus Nanopelagicaceae bacterium]
MTKFLALNISVSHDGFMAGPNQSESNPLGENGALLHSWAFATHAFQEWHGESGGSTGVDNEYIRRGFENVGATIMGRNMFGPIRGSWPNDDWKGWWGPNPGYQHEVLILTHHPRASIDMGNGTVFIFVTEGIESAYKKAMRAAKGKDVRVGGGAETIQQFMELGLLDELHVALVPVTLNSGEELFTDKALQLRRYRAIAPVLSSSVVHQTYVRN